MSIFTAEDAMKAVLALVIIYVGAFLIAIHGSSQNSVAAAEQNSEGAQEPSVRVTIDPAKEADIRSLMELVGARDMAQDAAAKGVEQFRENLLASVPDNDRGQQFVNAFLESYQKKFNPDNVTNQLVGIYDKHFTEAEIKSLLQFYGSPLGQKYAAELPKIAAELQSANRSSSFRAAKETLQDLRKEFPGIAAQARLAKQYSGQAQLQAQANSTQP
jgi:hypothetical protein